MQSNKEMIEIPAPTNIWVDIGATGADQALERVRPGDYVTVQLGVTQLLNDRIAAAGLDNKSGLFICLEVLRHCAAQPLDVALYVVSTVQEEIGSRGAQTAANRVQPDIGIAVDVVNATDDPGLDSPQSRPPCTIGGGPSVSSGPSTNPAVGKLLSDAADRLAIKWQAAPSGKKPANDANTIQVSDSSVATASLGIPQRNMHTQVELCSLKDIHDCVRTLVEFVRSLRSDTELRPMHFDQ
jgi:endoglucanase